MGIINISSIMEYGRPGGVLRKVGCVGLKEVGGHGPQAAIAMSVQAKKVAAGISESKTVLGGVDEERMDVDEEHNVHALSPLSSDVTARLGLNTLGLGSASTAQGFKIMKPKPWAELWHSLGLASA